MILLVKIDGTGGVELARKSMRGEDVLWSKGWRTSSVFLFTTTAKKEETIMTTRSQFVMWIYFLSVLLVVHVKRCWLLENCAFDSIFLEPNSDCHGKCGWCFGRCDLFDGWKSSNHFLFSKLFSFTKFLWRKISLKVNLQPKTNRLHQPRKTSSGMEKKTEGERKLKCKLWLRRQNSSKNNNIFFSAKVLYSVRLIILSFCNSLKSSRLFWESRELSQFFNKNKSTTMLRPLSTCSSERVYFILKLVGWSWRKPTDILYVYFTLMGNFTDSYLGHRGWWGVFVFWGNFVVLGFPWKQRFIIRNFETDKRKLSKLTDKRQQLPLDIHPTIYYFNKSAMKSWF